MNFHIWKGEPSWVQPPHVQEDGEEKAGQEGEVQDTARHLHGDQGGDGDDFGQIFTPA